jgi:hypothetical protein
MIFVECGNDIQLVLKLGFISEQIDHTGSKTAVFESLENESYGIGIVDEDTLKKQKIWLNNYPYIIYSGAKKLGKKKTARKESITLMKDQHSENKLLIEISPHLEGWIYEIANRERISPTDYGLPNTSSECHRRRTEKPIQTEFRRLLEEIIYKKRDWETKLMRKWIDKAINRS